MDIKLQLKAKTRKSSVFLEQMKGREKDVSLAAVILLHSRNIYHPILPIHYRQWFADDNLNNNKQIKLVERNRKYGYLFVNATPFFFERLRTN